MIRVLADNVEQKEKILLGILPYWTPLIPPHGIASLKGFLQNYGYTVKTVDLIVKKECQDTYAAYYEVLARHIPKYKQGNFYNIGHDVLQNQMMAHFKYTDEEEYLELVKILVYQSFYVNFTDEAAKELINVLNEFYAELERYFCQLLEEEKPDVLGLTVYKGTMPASLFVFKLARDKFPYIKTVMGGGAFADTHNIGSPNYEALLEETKDYVDKIMIGQGELLFLKWLQGELPADQRVYTKDEINGQFLDFTEQDIPDFSDFDLKYYPYLAATASSSCPYQCSFCNSSKFWGKYRVKDPKRTVQQMIQLYEKYGHQLFFMSDSLLNPIISELAEEFIKADASIYYDGYFRVDKKACNIENTLLWRRGGFYRARLGVESGSQRILNIMDKGITIEEIKGTITSLAYAGIKPTTYWVIGHPDETEEDFQQTLDLLEELKNDIWQAECNPFLYHFSGQFASDQWSEKRKLLYPESACKMLVFTSWTLECYPLREEAYDRMHRFVDHCNKLGIPNPYTMREIYEADERWERLHENSVPSAIAFKNAKTPINENKQIKQLSYLQNTLTDEGDFSFDL